MLASLAANHRKLQAGLNLDYPGTSRKAMKAKEAKLPRVVIVIVSGSPELNLQEPGEVLARVFGAARLGLVSPHIEQWHGGLPLEGHGAAQWFREVAPHGGDAIMVSGHFQWHLSEETDPGLLRVYNDEMLQRAAASAEDHTQAGGVGANHNSHAHGCDMCCATA